MNSSSADIQNIHSSMSNEWFTPAENIEAARTVLGAIDLDPASCELADRTVRATHYFTAQDD
jgi:ParB family chromosome partitioning protein